MGSRAMGCVVWVTNEWIAQLVSRCGGVCVARAPSPHLDLAQRVKHTLVEVDVCVAPEPLRLGVGSSNASGRVVASPAVASGAAGCLGAGFTATLRSDNFFRFLDHLALAQTRQLQLTI